MTPPDPGASDAARLRFEGVFREHYVAILAFALRRVRDRGAAEDAAAETFAVAWRRRADLPEPPLPWLYGVALKTLANQRRGQDRRRRLAERVAAAELVAPLPVDPSESLARRSSFAAAFARLEEGDREVLRLLAWDGLDPREAAQVLGCSPGAFRVRLHRARRRLRKQLEAAGHFEDERRDLGARPIEESR
jgi:RNA polymerase sigma-70 factor, ECF subfamily